VINPERNQARISSLRQLSPNPADHIIRYGLGSFCRFMLRQNFILTQGEQSSRRQHKNRQHDQDALPKKCVSALNPGSRIAVWTSH
jgi:hypothetical protein